MHPKIEHTLSSLAKILGEGKGSPQMGMALKGMYLEGLVTAFEIAATESEDVRDLALFEVAAERLRHAATAKAMLISNVFTASRGGDGADTLGPRKGGAS